MVTLLFTAIFIIGLLAITLYFWVPRVKGNEQSLLPPPNPPRGLFSEDDTGRPLLPSPSNDDERQHKSLIERAKAGDKSVLPETQAFGNQFYSEVLSQLVADANSAPTLLALASYVTRNDLPVNNALAEAVIRNWKDSPDRSSTATAMHLAALADDADLYRSTVEAALDFWRRGVPSDITSAELGALFDGEFWVLSARTRSSGAGFVLKRTLANARRELETATRVG
jgi:hypothetical protein